jgi:hypothetical protein
MPAGNRWESDKVSFLTRSGVVGGVEQIQGRRLQTRRTVKVLGEDF